MTLYLVEIIHPSEQEIYIFISNIARGIKYKSITPLSKHDVEIIMKNNIFTPFVNEANTLYYQILKHLNIMEF